MKNSTKTVQEAKKTAQKQYSKTDSRYWQKRIEKRTKGGAYSVRLQMGGKGTWFNLGTGVAGQAALKAKEIYFFAKSNGIQAAIEKFKYVTEKGAEIATVGQFIQLATGLSVKQSPLTLKQYVGCFRQLAFEIVIPEREQKKWKKLKFDYRGEGRSQWLQLVDAIRLEDINPESVRKWRAGKNATTAASQIRQAKALSAIVALDEASSRKVGKLPYSDVKTDAPRPKRHKSIVKATGEELAIAAKDELSDKDVEAWKAFILALFGGLRKEEIDSLLWEQIDLKTGTVHIRELAWFSPKTDDAIRDVDLTDKLRLELVRLKKKSRTKFVLKGGKTLPIKKQYHGYYRAKPTWKRLTAWLKSKGVTTDKPVHYLRKESGSLIASEFDIEAARRHLGHADISTTSAYYSDKKKRVAVEFPVGESGSNK